MLGPSKKYPSCDTVHITLQSRLSHKKVYFPRVIKLSLLVTYIVYRRLLYVAILSSSKPYVLQFYQEREKEKKKNIKKQ
jgi:hypothetical protein